MNCHTMAVCSQAATFPFDQVREVFQERCHANLHLAWSVHVRRHQKAVAKLFQSVGGRLMAWYLTFGHHDWLAIGEFPDAKAAVTPQGSVRRSEYGVASAVLAAAGGGSLSDVETREISVCAGLRGGRTRTRTLDPLIKSRWGLVIDQRSFRHINPSTPF